MNKVVLAVCFSIFALSVFGQTPAPTESAETTVLADGLRWLTGDWEGEGVSSADQGNKVEFLGKMKVSPDLDDEAIVIHRESNNKPGMPSGGNKEIMVVSMDGSTKNIIMTLHTSKNFIGIYKGEIKENEVIFTLATAPAGSVYRRVFKLLSDGALSFAIEAGSNGQQPSKQLEINFKKKS